MVRKRSFALPVMILTLSLSVLTACKLEGGKQPSSQKSVVRTLIVPKFEIGEITGDLPGEAQLFYEHYCKGCKEIAIPHLPETAHFYYNKDNGVALLQTGSSKTAVSLSLTATLLSDQFDFSDAYIVSVGCGGGSVGKTAFGDVVLVTSTCDYDLGHHVDSSELEASPDQINWSPDEDFVAYTHKAFNVNLCESVYQKIKDVPLQTTEKSKAVLEKSFGKENVAHENPIVLKGTAVTSDQYWKGATGHRTAEYITKYYGCPDPYLTTEMEEIAVANTASCFNMLDRVISLRVVVNMDMFLDSQSPKDNASDANSFTQKVKSNSDETVDIFEPAMHNLFDVGSIVIDDILSGNLKSN